MADENGLVPADHMTNLNQYIEQYMNDELNIQSLLAKFETLKLLLYKRQDQKIDIDFILICETFLTDIKHITSI